MSDDEIVDIIEDKSRQSIITDDDSGRVYQHIYNVNYIEDDEKKQESKEKKQGIVNKYIAGAIVAILIYTVSAWSGQIPITEIIDLELPITVFLSLILTSIIYTKYQYYGYIAYIILSIIIFLVNPSYTFMILTALGANLFVDCIDRICVNDRDYSVDDDKPIYQRNIPRRNVIFNYLHRIKYYVLLSLIIFLIATILGYYYPSIFQSVVLPAMQQLQQGTQNNTVVLETMPLFMNNFTVAVNMFLSGIAMSIQTLFLLIYNALLVGFTGSMLPISYFLSFTLPHGIIELTAIILAGASGFRVTHGILTILSGISDESGTRFGLHAKVGVKMILDSVLLMVVVGVLLIIAAFIEANLTVTIGSMIMGT